MNKLGKYELLGELGRGAFGIVYRARDPIINRTVALKTISTSVAENPSLLQRFYREAQSAGSLQHPNVVTIYDMGEEAGTPFIAMELIDGENLDDLIARRPALPVSLKVVYAVQACRALDYAHKRGIIHRDIKPGNVMVSKEGTVKVVDFGIARVMEASKTQTGMLIGTFAYMAPEIFHGEHADERTDIWSLGVLMYELLAYKRPFSGESPAALMQSVCLQEPLPLRQIVPECSEELESVVHRSLRKSESERFQTMEDLLLELEPICKRLQAETQAGLLANAQELIEQKEYEQARERLREALQVDSSNAQAKSLLEKVSVELKRIAVRPRAQEHIEKGRALLREGKLQEAESELENALQLDSRFEPAFELQRELQRELERAQMVNDWLQLLKHRLVEGLLEEAEDLLAKVRDAAPDNPQLPEIEKQILDEKARRQRHARLFDCIQQARALWARQKYDECIGLLTQAQTEFRGEEEIDRLLETAREDQAEQNKQERLGEARNLLAMHQYDRCIDALSKLQTDFPGDDEIRRLLDTAHADHAEQHKEESLAQARKLLAARKQEECIALLLNLRQEFPGQQEIERLLETAREEQREQIKQEELSEAHDLLAARRYDECIALLTRLEQQFPGEDEIHRLLETAGLEQIEHRKEKRLSEARELLAGRSYDACIALLLKLQTELPDEDEVSRLLATAREDQSLQNKHRQLIEARKPLAERRYGDAIALLTALLQQFPGDEEIRRVLDTAYREQAEQNKQEMLTKARDLLAARRYADCVAVLLSLQDEFPGNQEIARMLDTARQDQTEQNRQEKLSEARTLLAARRYEQCIALLSKIETDFGADDDIRTLLDAARHEQLEQKKQKKLADARKLLSARRYQECLALLGELQQEFEGDSEIRKLLENASEEQAEQHKREKLAEARKLLSARRFQECIALLTELQEKLPEDKEVSKALRTAREDWAEFDRKQKLVQARDLVAAQQFADAMQLLEPLLASNPGDSAALKLRSLLQRELDKQAKSQTLQRGWEELKKLDGEKAYSEVVARGEMLLKEFPGEPDLVRLVEFARSQQMQTERELRLQKSLDVVRALMNGGRFCDAAAAARAGLSDFPKNLELASLLQQAQDREKKELVRQLIERRIRDIKVKINRGQLSEAKKLAQETMATLGPDTDVRQLLTSAEVEQQAREKKKGQDQKLETVRTLLEAGKLTEATISLHEAIEAGDFDVLDPRVYTLSERIEAARQKGEPPPAGPGVKPETPFPEYAIVESSPSATGVAPSGATPQASDQAAPTISVPSQVPPLPSIASETNLQVTQPPQEFPRADSPFLQASAENITLQPKSPSEVGTAAVPRAPQQDTVLSQEQETVLVPSDQEIAPKRQDQETVLVPTEPETVLVPPEKEAARPDHEQEEVVIARTKEENGVCSQREQGSVSIPPEQQAVFVGAAEDAKAASSDVQRAAEPPSYKIQPIWIGAAFGILALVIGLAWFVLRPKPIATKPSAPPVHKSQPNPLEVQQRDLMAKADVQVAKNDLEGALGLLREAKALNGPLGSEVDKKLAQVDAGIKDAALRKLLHEEEQLWQQAQESTDKARFAEARQYLQKILLLPEGGRHKEEARQYFEKIIPQREHEERLFAEGSRAMKRSDPKSLERADQLFGDVAAMNGPRKNESLTLRHSIRETLANRTAEPLMASARQDIKRGDFRSARQKGAQLQQMGRDTNVLVKDINQAEQNRLAQLRASLNQLKQGDDVQGLTTAQAQLQSLAESGGPVADDARKLAASIPDIIRDVQTRATSKKYEDTYQQLILQYQRAKAGKDKAGLESARSELDKVARAGGPRANDAQKTVDQINTELAALKTPAAPPPTPNRPPISPVVDDEALIRAVVDRYAEAYQKRDADSLRQIWPTMDNKEYGELKQSFGMANAIRMHITINTVNVASDRLSATASGSVSQTYTPRNGKPQSRTDQIVFRVEKSKGAWSIKDVR